MMINVSFSLCPNFFSGRVNPFEFEGDVDYAKAVNVLFENSVTRINLFVNYFK
jgi:hypothetical protein